MDGGNESAWVSGCRTDERTIGRKEAVPDMSKMSRATPTPPTVNLPGCVKRGGTLLLMWYDNGLASTPVDGVVIAAVFGLIGGEMSGEMR